MWVYQVAQNGELERPWVLEDNAGPLSQPFLPLKLKMLPVTKSILTYVGYPVNHELPWGRVMALIIFISWGPSSCLEDCDCLTDFCWLNENQCIYILQGYSSNHSIQRGRKQCEYLKNSFIEKAVILCYFSNWLMLENVVRNPFIWIERKYLHLCFIFSILKLYLNRNNCYF